MNRSLGSSKGMGGGGGNSTSKTAGSNTDKEAMDAISSPTGGSILKVSSISESDWREPSLQSCNPMVLQTYGSNRAYDAFHLLQTDTAIQVLYGYTITHS